MSMNGGKLSYPCYQFLPNYSEVGYGQDRQAILSQNLCFLT